MQSCGSDVDVGGGSGDDRCAGARGGCEINDSDFCVFKDAKVGLVFTALGGAVSFDVDFAATVVAAASAKSGAMSTAAASPADGVDSVDVTIADTSSE